MKLEMLPASRFSTTQDVDLFLHGPPAEALVDAAREALDPSEPERLPERVRDLAEDAALLLFRDLSRLAEGNLPAEQAGPLAAVDRVALLGALAVVAALQPFEYEVGEIVGVMEETAEGGTLEGVMPLHHLGGLVRG